MHLRALHELVLDVLLQIIYYNSLVNSGVGRFIADYLLQQLSQ